MKRTYLAASLTAAMFAGAAVSVQAAPLGSYFVPYSINDFSDDSLELVFDVDGNDAYSVGDVNVGVIRINERIGPTGSGLLPADEIIGVFSITLTDITRDPVSGAVNTSNGGLAWAPTPTASPFSLASLGIAGTSDSSVAAIFSSVGFDPLTATPDDVAGNNDGSANFVDNIARVIASGTPELILGMLSADDYFVGTAAPAISGPLSGSSSINQNVSLATFNAGLSVEVDNIVNIDFETEVCAGAGTGDLPNTACAPVPFDALNPGTLHDVTVQGQLKGIQGIALAGDMTGTFMGTNFYGQSDNADFTLAPVPEPGVVALLGLGLVGVAASRKRLQKS